MLSSCFVLNMTISVVIPLHNGSTTIIETLKSLESHIGLVDEVFIMENGSTDNSLQLVQDYVDRSTHGKYVLFSTSTSLGLSGAYNKGIEMSSGDLIITLHQDVLLKDYAVASLLEPFFSAEKGVVATSHCVEHPSFVWRAYPFWQRCLFSRLLGKTYCGLDGKFDCFSRAALYEVGLFDSLRFRTAGEDGDIRKRLLKKGRISKTESLIIHLHAVSDKFSIWDYFYKHMQYSEAQGVLLRKHGIDSIQNFLKSFFREVLAVGVLFPYVRLIFLPLTLFYAIWYCKNSIIHCDKEDLAKLLLIVPVNVVLLYVSFFCSLKGFLLKRQRF
ncbi:glycosyltransferase [candidate division WWE3 bacterium]|nr:glycosyltransferase [candidate division WWE3 bacterium]